MDDSRFEIRDLPQRPRISDLVLVVHRWIELKRTFNSHRSCREPTSNNQSSNPRRNVNAINHLPVIHNEVNHDESEPSSSSEFRIPDVDFTEETDLPTPFCTVENPKYAKEIHYGSFTILGDTLAVQLATTLMGPGPERVAVQRALTCE